MKSFHQIKTEALSALSRLSALELEKDSLNARLRIIRKELKEAKTRAWVTKRAYTDNHIEDTKRQINDI
jgi:predicted  nucleic acid-binding Zn-ribbon protein